MPQNIEVGLRHLSLSALISLLCFIAACQKSLSSINFDYATNKADPISIAISEGAWDRVLKLATSERDPLVVLIRLRALYELKKFDEVLASPTIADERFRSYDIFLKTMSAYESSNWAQVVQFPIPGDLPRPLRERLLMVHGESHQEKGEPEQAQEIFQNFLKDFKRSSFRADVLTRLADIQLALGHEEEAVKYYEELYEFFPISDHDDLARQKLIDAGRFAQIDTDAHLTRIQQLRRAAHFQRASDELENLLKTASKEHRARLELAMAQVRFGERSYSLCEKLAKKALKTHLSEDLQIEWRQLLASTYFRLGDFENGEKQFKILLGKKIRPGMREHILLKLGSASLDHFNYTDAVAYFQELRSSFPQGAYIESAHWFEALCLYFIEQDRKENRDPAKIEEAQVLLQNLMNLPDAIHFGPQSLYLQSFLAQFLDQNDKSAQLKADLQKNWPLSFHTLLLNESPFRFLRDGRFTLPDKSAPTSPNLTVNFNGDLSWKRLELFRSVNFRTWASMELDQFLDANKIGIDSLNLAVAERLESVEDWANLVRWAERNLSRPQKIPDLRDPVIRFHYPLAYANDVLKNSAEFGISPFLVWGVMREESRYRADVISAAGAVGLMQLMPTLGKRISQTLKETTPKRGVLTDAKRNIRYGTYHLMELRDRVQALAVPEDLKPILQVAAYNAGFEAVSRWIKEKDISRPDLFVELIPYQETRGYVKRVLQSAYIYSKLYGSSKDELPPKTEKHELPSKVEKI